LGEASDVGPGIDALGDAAPPRTIAAPFCGTYKMAEGVFVPVQATNRMLYRALDFFRTYSINSSSGDPRPSIFEQGKMFIR
jgi:hypothetical protein